MQRTLVMLALLAATAHADDRSPKLALKLSAGVTVIGGAIALPLVFVDPSPSRNALLAGATTAFVIGPSLGHLYGGELWNRGLAMRLTGAALATGGLAWEKSDPGGSSVGALLWTAGYLTYLTGVYAEITSVKDHVRKLNDERYSGTLSSQLSIVPSGRGVALSGVW